MTNETKTLESRAEEMKATFLTKFAADIKALKEEFANSSDENNENTKEKENPA